MELFLLQPGAFLFSVLLIGAFPAWLIVQCRKKNTAKSNASAAKVSAKPATPAAAKAKKDNQKKSKIKNVNTTPSKDEATKEDEKNTSSRKIEKKDEAPGPLKKSKKKDKAAVDKSEKKDKVASNRSEKTSEKEEAKPKAEEKNNKKPVSDFVCVAPKEIDYSASIKDL